MNSTSVGNTTLEIFIEEQLSEVVLFGLTADALDIIAWLEKVDQIKSSILGKSYCLAINLVTKDEITTLNNTWRNQPKATDVLSFPYSNSEGEIFLCPEVISDRHALYHRTIEQFTLFLIVHAIYHLAGYDHGFIMRLREYFTRAKFDI